MCFVILFISMMRMFVDKKEMKKNEFQKFTTNKRENFGI